MLKCCALALLGLLLALLAGCLPPPDEYYDQGQPGYYDEPYYDEPYYDQPYDYDEWGAVIVPPGHRREHRQEHHQARHDSYWNSGHESTHPKGQGHAGHSEGRVGHHEWGGRY